MSTCEISMGLASSERKSNPPPPTNRRRVAFLAGRVLHDAIPRGLLSMPSQRRDPIPQKAKESGDRPHGGHRGPSKLKRKLFANASLNRLSLPQRKRLLARKCREAGVRTPMALALAK